MPALIPLIGALCLVAGTQDQFRVSNVRETYGLLGPKRDAADFLPGDEVIVCFDIEGAKADSSGKIRYAIGMEVFDQRGQGSLFRQAPRDNTVDAPPDGKHLEAGARIQVGLDQSPGDYAVKLSITDKTANATTEVTRAFRVAPLTFGIVKASVTSDQEGKLASRTLVSGRSAYLNLSLVGFGWDPGTNQPALDVTMQVLDDQGREVFPKPSRGSIREGAPAKIRVLPMQFELVLHRPGSFKIEVAAVDAVTGKRAALSLPVTITPSK